MEGGEMSDHIPDVTKMIGETPRTESFNWNDSGCDDPLHAWGAFSAELERELNAANSKIEALNRGNAAAERILCDAAGVGSGRDVLEWIVAAKDRIKRLEEAFTELEQCNLTDENCANMDVATRRVRNFARRAKGAKP
jgi:hypothetical protein